MLLLGRGRGMINAKPAKEAQARLVEVASLLAEVEEIEQTRLAVATATAAGAAAAIDASGADAPAPAAAPGDCDGAGSESTAAAAGKRRVLGQC